MINYIAVDEKLRKNVLDKKAVRGLFEGSDHYVCNVNKLKKREYGRNNDQRKMHTMLVKKKIAFWRRLLSGIKISL